MAGIIDLVFQGKVTVPQVTEWLSKVRGAQVISYICMRSLFMFDPLIFME